MTDQPIGENAAPSYKYLVQLINGMNFEIKSTFQWGPLITIIRADGYVATNEIFAPMSAIAFIRSLEMTPGQVVSGEHLRTMN